MNKKLEQLKKLLTDADALAKEIADANPVNANAQALRARCHAAAEMAGTVTIEEKKESAVAPAR